mgnify:CR=1 FL=1
MNDWLTAFDTTSLACDDPALTAASTCGFSLPTARKLSAIFAAFQAGCSVCSQERYLFFFVQGPVEKENFRRFVQALLNVVGKEEYHSILQVCYERATEMSDRNTEVKTLGHFVSDFESKKNSYKDLGKGLLNVISRSIKKMVSELHHLCARKSTLEISKL